MRMINKIAVSLLIVFAWSFTIGALANKPASMVTYADGSACYQRLKADSKARKNRARWQECIAIFESIASNSPSSNDAPRANYSAARLTRELYGQKKRKSDLGQALKYYNRVVIDYPKSRLADDALYQIAQVRYYQMNDRERAKKALRAQIKRYPRGDTTPQAKAMLKKLEGRGEDAKKEDAKKEKDRAYSDPAVETSYPADVVVSDMRPASSKQPALLLDVKQHRAGDETIVTLQFDRPLPFRTIFEGGEGGRRAKSSLEIQLKETHEVKGLAKKIRVNSPTVRSIRVGPRILGGTKVTVALRKNTDYRLVQHRRSLDVIFRSAIIEKEARMPRTAKAAAASYEAPPPPSREKKKSSFSLGSLLPWKKDRKAKGAGPLRVVIDPGHGGEEDGAIGPHGIREKDVVQQIAQMLAQDLRRELGAKVWLTRQRDKTVSLKKRYKTAKRRKADLFISIHANASTDKRHRGIETYYLNNASDDAAKKLAMRENESWKGPKSDIDAILATMLQNAMTDESRELAVSVQTSLVQNMRKRYKGIKNRKARSALFYVLVGTQCPSILVETSFITNPREEMRLADPTYQQEIASSIAEGVKEFVAKKPAAYSSL